MRSSAAVRVAPRVGLAIVAVLLVVGALAGLTRLWRVGLADAALYNGDEAIYAQMAREMLARRAPAELTFDGVPLHPRPPAAVWALAIGYALAGDAPPEPPLRAVLVTLCALEVALTGLLGTLLFGARVGLCAGALLAFADLFVGYARVYESEPLLCCCVLLALCGWARRSRAGWWLFGVGLGGALLTKQLVGLLPLAAPIADRLVRRSDDPPAPAGLREALGLAALVAVPWHVVMVARHGTTFVDSFFLHSLAGRAGVALLHRTSPLFYLTELGRSEGWPFAIGQRRRRPAELLVGGWALGVIAVYSAARSRHDYYLLLAYPALWLAAAWLLLAVAPTRAARLRALTATALCALAALVHLPRNLVPTHGDDEVRALLAATGTIAPGAPLYSLGRHPYAARVYGDRPVRVFVEHERDLEAARTLAGTGMPAPAQLARPVARAFELAARPSLFVYPRARGDVLAGVAPDRYRVLGESPGLRLLLLP